MKVRMYFASVILVAMPGLIHATAFDQRDLLEGAFDSFPPGATDLVPRTEFRSGQFFILTEPVEIGLSDAYLIEPEHLQILPNSDRSHLVERIDRLEAENRRLRIELEEIRATLESLQVQSMKDAPTERKTSR